MAMGKMYRVKRTKQQPRSVPRPVARYVNRAVHKVIEKKVHGVDLGAEFNAISTVWNETDLTILAEGTDVGDRVGRRVTIKSIDMKFILYGVDTTNALRWVIGVYNGASPATPLATAGTGMNSIIARTGYPRNFLVRKLLDKYLAIDGADNHMKVCQYHKYFKRGVPIIWGDNTTNYPSLKIMMAMISDSGAAAHPYIQEGFCKVTFEDA